MVEQGTVPFPRWFYEKSGKLFSYSDLESETFENFYNVTKGMAALYVEDRLIDVCKRVETNLKTKKQLKLIRGTWFFENEDNTLVPYTEDVSKLLEDTYMKSLKDGKKFRCQVSSDPVRVVEMLSDGTLKQYRHSKNADFNGRRVQRGFEGRLIQLEVPVLVEPTSPPASSRGRAATLSPTLTSSPTPTHPLTTVTVTPVSKTSSYSLTPLTSTTTTPTPLKSTISKATTSSSYSKPPQSPGRELSSAPESEHEDADTVLHSLKQVDYDSRSNLRHSRTAPIMFPPKRPTQAPPSLPRNSSISGNDPKNATANKSNLSRQKTLLATKKLIELSEAYSNQNLAPAKTRNQLQTENELRGILQRVTEERDLLKKENHQLKLQLQSMTEQLANYQAETYKLTDALFLQEEEIEDRNTLLEEKQTEIQKLVERLQRITGCSDVYLPSDESPEDTETAVALTNLSKILDGADDSTKESLLNNFKDIFEGFSSADMKEFSDILDL